MTTPTILAGDCLDVIRTLADCSIDAVVTDPPYALVSIGKRFGADDAAPAQFGRDGAYARASAGFMGKKWDTGEVAFNVEFWREVLRVLKPGGHAVAFGGTRTYHRMACAIEDAGFEIRDQLQWLYGTGFPKSHDVSKGIDKAAGAVREVVGSKLDLPGYHLHGHDGGEAFGTGLSSSTFETRLKSSQITAPATDAARQWAGWGTALKPANEPICLARKPLSEGTVAANVLRWGTGALNIDATRVETDAPRPGRSNEASKSGLTGTGGAVTYGSYAVRGSVATEDTTLGRWPANVMHDGSPEVVAMFPETGAAKPARTARKGGSRFFDGLNPEHVATWPADNGGSAARFFYSSKASKLDRAGSKHPTVKPISLMRWLVRLVTPPGGTILDPFAGSGTTGVAALAEGFACVLIEREAEYLADIRRRLGLRDPVEALLEEFL